MTRPRTLTLADLSPEDQAEVIAAERIERRIGLTAAALFILALFVIGQLTAGETKLDTPPAWEHTEVER